MYLMPKEEGIFISKSDLEVLERLEKEGKELDKEAQKVINNNKRLLLFL